MTNATLPQPADYELTWGDIWLLVRDAANRTQQKILIERFYISEKVADAWLEGARRYGREG